MNETKIQIFNSNEFLLNVNKAVKINKEVPSLNFEGKKVIVLGAGNTAIDCCEVA